MRRFYIILTLALLMSGGIFGLRAQTPEGVVIAHTPKSEVKYIGSPSIAISPDDVYVVSHDFFGKQADVDAHKVTTLCR